MLLSNVKPESKVGKAEGKKYQIETERASKVIKLKKKVVGGGDDLYTSLIKTNKR